MSGVEWKPFALRWNFPSIKKETVSENKAKQEKGPTIAEADLPLPLPAIHRVVVLPSKAALNCGQAKEDKVVQQPSVTHRADGSPFSLTVDTQHIPPN